MDKAFLRSFSVRAEELDKNSDGIRPLDREFNELSRKNESVMLVTYSASFGNILYAYSWKICVVVIATTGNAKETKHFLLLRLVSLNVLEAEL